MRVAVWHNLPSGGGKRALADHVDGLIDRGHHVEVWVPPHADVSAMPFQSNVTQHIVPLELRDSSKWGPCPPTPVLKRQLNAMANHLDLVAREIHKSRFDVVLGGSCQLFRAVDLPRRLDLPTVLYLQEPFRWLYEALPEVPLARPRRHANEPIWRWRKRWLRDLVTISGQRTQARFEIESARTWSRILVNSMFSRESVRRAYGLDAEVCYLGVNIDRFHSDFGTRGPNLLGVGALVPEKGSLRVVEAIAELPPPRPPLTWVGNVASPAFVGALESAARLRGVDLDIRIGITDEELRQLMRQSRALVYAPVLEPFGLAPLEASAAGLPVVALAEAGVRETVVDGVNGLVVQAMRDMPGAIARICADDALVQDLARTAVRHVEERWSIGQAVDRLEAQLFDLAGAP